MSPIRPMGLFFYRYLPVKKTWKLVPEIKKYLQGYRVINGRISPGKISNHAFSPDPYFRPQG